MQETGVVDVILFVVAGGGRCTRGFFRRGAKLVKMIVVVTVTIVTGGRRTDVHGWRWR